MAEHSFPFFREQSYTVSAKAVSDVLSSGSGDAALLLLYLMQHTGEYRPDDAMRSLRFSPRQLEAAQAILSGQPLPEETVDAAPVPPGERPRDAVRLKDRPSYTRAELAGALSDPDFAYLYQQAERIVGHALMQYEVSALFTMYDYLRLPADVIALLLNYVAQDAQRRSTPDQPVSVSFRDIKAEAVRWHENGVVSAAEAERYIEACERRRSATGKVLRILGIQDRVPSPTERRFIEQMIEMDPSLDLIALAYDTTVVKKGSLIWPYMRTILQNWIGKGYRTPEDVENGERARKSSPAYRGGESRQDVPSEAYNEEVLRYLRQNEERK